MMLMLTIPRYQCLAGSCDSDAWQLHTNRILSVHSLLPVDSLVYRVGGWSGALYATTAQLAAVNSDPLLAQEQC